MEKAARQPDGITFYVLNNYRSRGRCGDTFVDAGDCCPRVHTQVDFAPFRPDICSAWDFSHRRFSPQRHPEKRIAST
jgi:hypothetical protein